jgi:cyclic pyranopterin phosphate synthase
VSSPVLTHLDADGRPRMVDVGEKAPSARRARAEGHLVLGADAFARATGGGGPKGDPLQIARLAGIMGAKRTADLIPLCHPLPLDGVTVDVTPTADGRLRVVAEARTTGRTGVEMEALTAVTVACLTIYDMLKAVDRGMRIEGVRLLEKDGGRSGAWRADPA